MVAYEFYCHDAMKGYQLIGILPERRKNPERITQKSIMNWVKKYFNDNLNLNDIFFIQVEIETEPIDVL
jgi:hypothetical protein